MVLTFNPRNNRAAVLGIPRDIKWDIPGFGRDKINHSYAFGGVDLTRECVEDLIGARIDYHLLVQFHGFTKVVDKLGGVWVDVPDVEGRGRGMNYDEKVRVMRTHVDHDGHLHLHLKPGYQKLDGAGALGFVRYRKSTLYRDRHGNWAGDSDVARSARQQQFLKAMAQQHLKVTNVKKLAEATGEMRKHFTTDLAWEEIYDVLRVMKEVDTDALWTGTVPIDDDPAFFSGGIYYAIVLERSFAQVKSEMERHLSGLPTNLGHIEVLNASGIRGQAGDAAERLAAKGFPVRTVGNADTFDAAKTQIIITSEEHKEGARVAQSVLACGDLVVVEPDSDNAPSDGHDIRVMLGQDYRADAAERAAGRG